MVSTTSATASNHHPAGAAGSSASTKTKVRRGRPRLDVEPRRQRVLTAAAELFFQRGFDGTTLDAVSKAAGVTKQAVYELVGDKLALFQAVCKYTFASRDTFRPPLPDRLEDLQPSLEAIAHRLLDHSLSDGILNLARAMVIEGIRFPELALDVVDAGRRQISEILAHYFEALSTCHFIGSIDALEAADIFYDLAVGARGFRKAMGYQEPLPDAVTIRKRVEVFIAGYLAPHTLD